MRTLKQLVVIGVLAAAAAALSNVARSGNPEKFLSWWPEGRYPNATTVRQADAEGVEPSPSRDREKASSTDGSSEEGVDERKEETKEEPYAKVTFEAAIEYARDGATFIDARRSREYLAGHIPGAYSVSAWESPGEKISAIMESGDVVQEAPVVVYCSSSKECEDSLIVSNLLTQAGFIDIVIYKGGFPEWQHKLPEVVHKGEERGELDFSLLPEEVREE